MNVQLLKEVQNERIDLRKQPHEEDDGKTHSEDCMKTQKLKMREKLNIHVYTYCCIV